MRVLLINPNTNEEMTRAALDAGLKFKDSRTELVGITNTSGPLSIEGYFDEVMTTPGVLEIIISEEGNYDAFIIACYSGHPAIIASREITAKPVVRPIYQRLPAWNRGLRDIAENIKKRDQPTLYQSQCQRGPKAIRAPV
ncbi:MAG: aspartate/glutamate racemase family protein [bacterium]